MSFNSINKAFENRFNVSKNILNEELQNKEVKANAKSKLLEGVDKILSERHWKFTIPGNYRNAIFDAADEEDFDGVRFALMDICQYVVDHIEESEEFDEESIEDIKDEYNDLLEELDYQDFEDEDECNYWLNELYDLMDNTDIFLGLRESLSEAVEENVDDCTKEVLDFLNSKNYDITDRRVQNYADAVAEYIDMAREATDSKYSLEDWYQETLVNYPEELEDLPASFGNEIPGGEYYQPGLEDANKDIDFSITNYGNEEPPFESLKEECFKESLWTDLVKKVPELAENINEDTEKTPEGKWVNKGEEGTHGEFRTKKEADAQRKAMFANGYHEDYERSGHEGMYLVCWDDQLGDYHESKVKADYPQQAIDKVTKQKNVYKVIDCKKVDMFISPARIRKAEIVESLKESVDQNKLNTAVYHALADVCFEFNQKDNHPTEEEMDLAYDWFATHFWDSDDYMECLNEDTAVNKITIPKPYNKYFKISGEDPSLEGYEVGEELPEYHCRFLALLEPKKEEVEDIYPILTDDLDYPVVEDIMGRLTPVELPFDECLTEEKTFGKNSIKVQLAKPENMKKLNDISKISDLKTAKNKFIELIQSLDCTDQNKKQAIFKINNINNINGLYGTISTYLLGSKVI